MGTARFRGMLLAPLVICIGSAASRGDEPAPASVAAIQDAHDRALVRDLKAYIEAHPKAEDLENACMIVFNKAIEHDWFADHEALAASYLVAHPDGPIHSLARIVTTMARAQAGRYDEALARFKDLMRGLGKPDQEEFAVNFADSLASAASTSGEYAVARQVYEALLKTYGESPNLEQKVKGELRGLDRVGKPAPSVSVTDVKGKALKLEDLKGKYILVDFWATWCAPCIAELPRLQAAYAKYHGDGFEIVGVSLDETKSALVDFVQARNLPWRQVHNASSGGDLVEAFGVGTIPATFLIDPEGTIVRLELRGPALDQALAKLIKPAAGRTESEGRTR